MFFYGTTTTDSDSENTSGIKLNRLALLASVITLFGYLPQVYKVATTSDVRSFSMITLIANSVASVMWVIFGFANDIPANILSGVVFLFMNIYFVALSL